MDAVNASIVTPVEPSTDNSNATPVKRLPGLTKTHSVENCAPSTPSHLQKLTPKQIVIKERQATDFFGRVIQVKFAIIPPIKGTFLPVCSSSSSP